MDKRRIAFIVLAATLLGLLPMATPASGFFRFRPSGAFHSVPSTRIVDTGKNLGITGPLGQGAKATVTVAGAGGVPATGATAVMLRVTASGATKPTLVTTEGKALAGWWLTPGAILPVVPRHTSAATLAVPLTSTGTITVANQFGKVGLTVDVLGWWGTATPPPPPPSTTNDDIHHDHDHDHDRRPATSDDGSPAPHHRATGADHRAPAHDGTPGGHDHDDDIHDAHPRRRHPRPRRPRRRCRHPRSSRPRRPRGSTCRQPCS